MKIIPYCYFRVSTIDQVRNGGGLDAQKDAVMNYIEDKKEYFDIDKKKILLDEGKSAFSGKNITEGKLGLFFKSVKNKEIGEGSALICYSIDRLSRQTTWVGSTFIGILIDSGIEIHSVAEGVVLKKNDPYGAILANIFLLRGNNESSIKSERSRDAYQRRLRESIKHNVVLTKQMPRWLYDENGKYSIKPFMKKIIEYIFEHYINGVSSGYIAKELNQREWLYKETLWKGSYVAKLLRDRRLIGEHIRYSRQVRGEKREIIEVIPDFYPSVIDKNTFNVANTMLTSVAENIRGRTRISYNDGTVLKNIFSNKIFCGKCNGSITVVKNSNPKAISFIRCRNKHELKTCTQKDVKYLTIENAILKYLMGLDITKLLKKPINNEVENYKEELKQKYSDREEIEAIIKNRKDNNKRIRPSTVEVLENINDDIELLIRKIGDFPQDDFIPNFDIDINRINNVSNVVERGFIKKSIESIASKILYTRINNYIIINIYYHNINDEHVLVIDNKSTDVIVNYSVIYKEKMITYKCNSLEVYYDGHDCYFLKKGNDLEQYSHFLNFLDYSNNDEAKIVKNFIIKSF